jgi:hypothetical protein
MKRKFMHLGLMLSWFFCLAAMADESSLSAITTTDFGAKGYFYEPKPMDWFRAKENCERKGGTLATVKNHAELEYILWVLPASVPPLWIGAYEKEEGDWRWLSGEGFDHGTTPWLPGEPNNQYRSEHWGIIWENQDKVGLNDAYAFTNLASVCEFPK